MRNVRRDSHGFTLLEMVLAMGLSALVIYTIVSIYTSYNQQLTDLNQRSDVAADIEGGEQIMLKDLKASDPSFGITSLKDDMGQAFFDYYPDVPEAALPKDATCGRPCRTYTMKPGAFSEIVFAIVDTSAHELTSFVYNPSWPYKLTPSSGNQNPGPPPVWNLTQAGAVGQGVYADGQIDGKGACDVPGTRGCQTLPGSLPPVVLYPGYWRNGQVLMFDTPVSFRPPPPSSYSPNYDASVVPRPAFLMGVVGQPSGSAHPFTPLSVSAFDTKKIIAGGTAPAASDQSNLLITTNPSQPVGSPGYNMYSDAAYPQPPDAFFERLPAIGGGQPTVRLRPIKLVKYSIEVMFPNVDPNLAPSEKAKRTGALRVWRTVYLNGAWPASSTGATNGRQMIAEYVKSVQFKRATITDKSISFTLSKVVLKGGNGQ